ncbi:MAG TPA: squalene synthase HpnC [Rhizomicrobium sp.]
MTNMNTTVGSLSSGKGHRDENFPVASYLIHSRHRRPILAFYRFARVADDVADHPKLQAAEKLRVLDDMRRSLLDESDVAPDAVLLRSILRDRQLTAEHALDLLEAFRRDVTRLRYETWDELMDYCRYSAMPVGRFVLDVHGEAKSLWPASDALCAALQIVNHLQDCGRDYRALDRVYIPQAMLAAAGLTVDVLGADHASPALMRVIESLAQNTGTLLAHAKPFSGQIFDFGLALEVSIIQRLAEDLVRRLISRDPLSERVHHRPAEALRLAAAAAMGFVADRPRTRSARKSLAVSHR